MVFENPIQSISAKALLTDYREMNDYFDILLNDFQLPEPGWVARNPNKFVTILFVLQRDCDAIDELLNNYREQQEIDVQDLLVSGHFVYWAGQ